jgi:3'-phosphoadenosine 5'-phosphosulfate (PAPS) 3'-phosphatase
MSLLWPEIFLPRRGSRRRNSTNGTHQPAIALAPDVQLACAAVRAGGSSIMRHFGNGSASRDLEVESYEAIREVIGRASPADRLLSRIDSAADHARAERVWIVEPLDGTREFMSRVPEFAVMAALWSRAKLTTAAIYLPADDALYFAAAGCGAYKVHNQHTSQVLAGTAHQPVRVVAGRSFLEYIVVDLCSHIGAVMGTTGSLGLRSTLIAEGSRDLCVHAIAALPEWATAAPELILREAGVRVTDCTGAALTYNKVTPVHDYGFLAGVPDVHEQAIAYLLERINARG